MVVAAADRADLGGGMGVAVVAVVVGVPMVVPMIVPMVIVAAPLLRLQFLRALTAAAGAAVPGGRMFVLFDRR
ncbi:hypothetical protein KYC_09681 [Achromobacter arsenitoxydans SY8]|uniref:Uncharacterized protein n=1 Tax=Achromobacter arsenitoxydans SY8 TaxID=477184 RepID=H0F593_9BURK|nr:hypothetical protein KYC_09681 [Achromobacter arsenitoxydans SY8]